MQAIILAGGKGTRLLPHTANLPKPLMPMGEMPILEIIVMQLKNAGASSIILAVGYLHHMIEAHFGDGSDFGIPISYSLEDKPLGTAGPLNLIYKKLEENFIVLNGDLLTTLNFESLFNEHLRSNASATIATFKRTVDIDFGVLEIDSEKKLVEYKEKPTLNYQVSMGINVFKKNSLKNLLQNAGYLDIPDLMMGLKNNGEDVLCHYEDCEWLDIGRIDDYSIATKIFEENKEKFLPKTK